MSRSAQDRLSSTNASIAYLCKKPMIFAVQERFAARLARPSRHSKERTHSVVTSERNFQFYCRVTCYAFTICPEDFWWRGHFHGRCQVLCISNYCSRRPLVQTFLHYLMLDLPASDAVIKHDKHPVTSDLKPTAMMSVLLAGAIAVIPPIMIPSEPMLENPHNAYVATISDLSWNGKYDD